MFKNAPSILLFLPVLVASGCGRIGGSPTLTSNGYAISNNYAVTAIGDSLTAGNQDRTGTTYPNQLASLIPQSVANLGVYGQRTGDIVTRTLNAYSGQSEQTFAAGFAIPTSGSVTVTFQSGYNPAFNTVGLPISTVASGTSYELSCSDFDPAVDQTATCTPITYPGSAVTVPSGNAWLSLARQYTGGTLLIWGGRDNIGGIGDCPTLPITGSNCPIVRDIAAAVAVAVAHGGTYAVLSIFNTDNEPRGSIYYNEIVGINTYLAAAYGSNYLDVRSYLISKGSPANAADVIDQENDVPPYSLRAEDWSNTLAAAITSSSQTSINVTDGTLYDGLVMSVGSELMLCTICYGTSGTVTRGYANTPAATYASGTVLTGVDGLHPGQNASSPANPNYTNGYTAVAGDVYSWFERQ